MAGKSQLRPVDHLLLPAVRETIRMLDASAVDAGAVRLAESYARTVDDAPAGERVDVLREFGPKLLMVLESLGATPRARSTLKGGAPARGSSWLEDLRGSRGA